MKLNTAKNKILDLQFNNLVSNAETSNLKRLISFGKLWFNLFVKFVTLTR